MEVFCSKKECLYKREKALNTKCFKTLHAILKRCDKCSLINENNFEAKLTKRIVKKEFEYAMFK